jgi:hypothetical protein
MSLSETQQIMQVLQEIMALLNGVEFKTEKINNDLPKTRESLDSFNQLERVALRYLAISRRMGLPDDINGGIQKLAGALVTLRMAMISTTYLMLGTPLGVAMGGAGLVMAGLSGYDAIAGGN